MGLLVAIKCVSFFIRIISFTSHRFLSITSQFSASPHHERSSLNRLSRARCHTRHRMLQTRFDLRELSVDPNSEKGAIYLMKLSTTMPNHFQNESFSGTQTISRDTPPSNVLSPCYQELDGMPPILYSFGERRAFSNLCPILYARFACDDRWPQSLRAIRRTIN